MSLLRRLRPYLSLLILFFVSGAHADEWTWQDFKDEVSSPLDEPARKVTFLGGAAALTVTIFEDQLADPTEEDVYDDRPLGSASIYGDMAGQLYPNFLYAGAMFYDGWISGDANSKRRAESMTKATLYSSALTTILKYTIREPRPNSDNRDSFPSGHTTTATAFAAVVVCEHGWGAAGVGATALASLTAFSRLNDNRHYLHDVLAGAVIGTGYGIGIASLGKRNVESVSEEKETSAIVPVVGRDNYGLAWFKTF